MGIIVGQLPVSIMNYQEKQKEFIHLQPNKSERDWNEMTFITGANVKKV
jgi:hypothetical protein